jgi:acyl carrier protein
MNTETDVRTALRRWIAETSGKIAHEDLADDTPLFRDGILKSVQVTDLILYIEELGETAVNVEKIMPGVFRDIDTICRNFFGHDHA